MSSADPARAATNDADASAVASALRLKSFFPEFTGEQCAKIFPRSGVASYAAGEFVVEQGESGRDLYVLLEGTVSVTLSMGSAGAEVATLGAGDVFGEMAMLRDGRRTASAMALTAARAFRLSFDDMGYVLKNNPELAAHLKDLAEKRAS